MHCLRKHHKTGLWCFCYLGFLGAIWVCLRATPWFFRKPCCPPCSPRPAARCSGGDLTNHGFAKLILVFSSPLNWSQVCSWVLQRAAASPEGAAEFALAALGDDDIGQRLSAGARPSPRQPPQGGLQSRGGSRWAWPGPVLTPGCSGTRRPAPWTWSRCGGGTRGPDARRWGPLCPAGRGTTGPILPSRSPVGVWGAALTLSRLGPRAGWRWPPLRSLFWGRGTANPIVHSGAERVGDLPLAWQPFALQNARGDPSHRPRLALAVDDGLWCHASTGKGWEWWI